MSIADKSTIDYINEIQPLFSGVLGEVQRDALEKNIPVLDPEAARLLDVLTSIIRPAKVLEIGCAIGFSAGLIRRNLASGGHITTIDRYDLMIEQAKTNISKMEMSGEVTLLEGDAAEILPTLTGEYDLIFLDAAKGQYLKLLPDCIRLLKTGGLFIADDILQGGRIAADRYEIPRRQRTIQVRMRKFLYAVSNTPGLVSSIVPIGDGMLVAHKVAEVKEINYGE